MKTKHFPAYLFSILLSLFVLGCINYEQATTLNTDGSGTMDIHYWINESVSLTGSQGNFAFDRENINKQYEAIGIKVKDVRIESNTSDSTKHVRVKLEFTDITQLSKAAGFKTSGFEWTREGNKITFKQNLHSSGGGNMDSFGLDKFTFTYVYNFPGEIVSTNATSFSGHRAEWKFKLSDLSSDRSLIAVIKVSWFSLRNMSVTIAVIAVIVMLFLYLKRRKNTIQSSE
jgi:hypothetical protein